MQTKAILRNLRIAPRKVRLVADLIRRKKVLEAQTILRFVHKSASEPFQKILQSALSSAKNNLHLEESNLYIAKIVVDEGAKLKRWRPRARGRAYPIEKKTSHITVVLGEVVPSMSREASEQTSKSERAPIDTQEEKRSQGNERQKFQYGKKLQKKKSEGVRSKIFRRKAI